MSFFEKESSGRGGKRLVGRWPPMSATWHGRAPEAVRARLAAGHDAAAAGASRDKPAAECIADRGTMALN
jgi:hypothetical protein